MTFRSALPYLLGPFHRIKGKIHRFGIEFLNYLYSNNLVINNSKCNETLKVNFKPPKSNNNKNNDTDNSEGKMACIIS
jgi:hypothetical protein